MIVSVYTHLFKKCCIAFLLLYAAGVQALSAAESDWPQWRHDAQRSNTTPHELDEQLYVQWVRELGTPRPAWPKNQHKLHFDVSYEPVVADGLVFVPSMVTDSISAYSTETGELKWRFHTDGPVRFAPAVYSGNVYAGSDDGCLYCLDAQTGEPVWKVRGAPSERKVIGNRRMISMRPVRGAPVVYGSTVYFAAGIWPFMGICIHAVDAETGKVIWTNSGSGASWTVQQHSSPAFAGVVPQGYIAASENVLLVSGGRTVPAAYSRKTGTFLYYRVASRQFGKDAGGYEVTIAGDRFFNGTAMYDLRTGKGILSFEKKPGLITRDTAYLCQYGYLTALRIPSCDIDEILGDKGFRSLKTDDIRWSPLSPCPERVFLKAGKRIYCGARDGTVMAVEPDETSGAAVTWKQKISGSPWSMAAADSRLFVVTREGTLVCFGGKKRKPVTYSLNAPLKNQGDGWGMKAEQLLKRTGVRDGYALVLGVRSGRLIEELHKRSGLHQVVVVPDRKAGDRLRENLSGLVDPVPEFLLPELTGVSWPDEWQVLGPFPRGRRELSGDDLKTIPKSWTIQGKRRVPRPLRMFGRMLDFSLLFGGYSLDPLEPGSDTVVRKPRKGKKDPASAGRIAYAFARINCAEACRIRIGAGADWWMKWFVDGKAVYSTMRRGNIAYPYAADNHIFSVDLSAGPHVIAVLVKAGSESWTLFTSGGDDLAQWMAERNSPFPPARRLSIVTGDRQFMMLPPCFADLITSEDPDARWLEETNSGLSGLFELLRPYGGTACFPVPEERLAAAAARLKSAGLPGADISADSGYITVRRSGKLKGSGYWTHQYADPANTVVSQDNLVRLPLGLLWFGGASNRKILPRHGHGPSPQVAGGRLFIEGENILRALDVYTGRLLWEKNVPRIGWYYRHTDHHPGANEIGSNYVSLPDAVYLFSPRVCMMIDAATGKTKKEFTLPSREGGRPARWGSVRVLDNLLIATTSPLKVLTDAKPRKKKKQAKESLRDVPIVKRNADYASASEALTVMDRFSGSVLWTRTARYSFRHNAVAAAGNRIFCIDAISEKKMSFLKRRGYTISAKPVLYALDARTGRELWKADSNIFGTWLGYSEEHDLLLQAGSRARDRARDEAGKGMTVYRGIDGSVLWRSSRKYSGPCLLHHETIITQRNAFSLLTGKPIRRTNPVTGRPMPWTFKRMYGCNTVIGSENMLTFRSAAAGFFGLGNMGGTGNLGGFKSGCTSNLIAADGVLAAPDYTRTCTCSYQNQASLAMVHMPGTEMWTFNDFAWNGERVKRLGLNFGAPGDRMADSGTLWLDSPSVGGPSPKVPVTVKGARVRYFRNHSMYVKEGAMKWVTASGVTGADSITVTLARNADDTCAYTVRLYFADFTGTRAGRRVFDVSVQRKKVLSGFDIFKTAGGSARGVMKEFTDISAQESLRISFSASAGESLVCGIEITETNGE